MPRFLDNQINNIYLRCNSIPLSQLLEWCLDPESGITIEGLRSVNYNKISQLESQYGAQAEEMEWALCQSSIDRLTAFIDKCQQGIFSTTHLGQAKNLLIQLAAQVEEEEWNKAKTSNSLDMLNDYIKKCQDGIYSQAHLQQAKDEAERIDWNQVMASHDSDVINGFILKCNTGIYSSLHLAEAHTLQNQLINSTIVVDWNAVVVVKDVNAKRDALNNFIQKYENNPAQTAQEYLAKAKQLMEQLADAEKARIDWINAKQENTILSYSGFVEAHPYSEYREEAENQIVSMKEDLLTDMKRFPFKYNRDDMYKYISTNALTLKDLVDDSCVLTDRGYSHIKRYPTLRAEQRTLPVSRLENPVSESGNTDIYFFGVSGSGKTCVLAGLLSLQGRLGFRFDPKGPGGGGSYAQELRHYARTSMLPPATDQNYIQVIDAQINDEGGNLHKISLIEMSGEKTAQFASIDNPTRLEDMGPGAAGLLSNDNDKVFFFVIDPTNEKDIRLGDNQNPLVVMQSDVLDCVSSLLSKNPRLMKKVVAMHVILTKSDTLGDDVDQTVIQDRLNEQGYASVLSFIKEICQKYDINKQTGFHVGLFPFCIGKFMPGDVYTFDETDSLKILRVIQKNTLAIRPKTVWDKMSEWFNS